ncbi:MAG: PaaI family thioesterase [Actinomycetota bacterium]
MGCAVQSTLPAGSGYTTLEFKVNLVRPITAETRLIRCRAEIVHVGRRTGTAEARVTDPSGRLLAHATTTCLILRPEE